MRVSLGALALTVALCGCGTAASLDSPTVPGNSASGLSAAAIPGTAGWGVSRAWYGGGDGEGIISLDLYGPESDLSTHSVDLQFTDMSPDGGFGQDPFRVVRFDGNELAPGSEEFMRLRDEISGAVVPLGVDERIVKGAATILAEAHLPALRPGS